MDATVLHKKTQIDFDNVQLVHLRFIYGTTKSIIFRHPWEIDPEESKKASQANKDYKQKNKFRKMESK